MKKLEIYLDTSVISHLFANDTPEKMQDTHLFWDDLLKDEYKIFLSQLVLDEIGNCPEPKRSNLLSKLRELNFSILTESNEVEKLAYEYVESGVLRKKSLDDCFHIAYAVLNNCDVIVSWNFKHLVNYRTIDKIKIVNAIKGYKEISIVSPSMLLM